jgi:hypothetical protein
MRLRSSRQETPLYPTSCCSADVQHYLRPKVSKLGKTRDISPFMHTHLRPAMTRATQGPVTPAPFPSPIEKLRGFHHVAHLNPVRYSVD